MNRLLISLLFIFISCNLPEPTSPNTGWTQIDEYPIYNQCPVDDVNSNWSCFTKLIEKKIDKKINQKNISISNLDETVYLKLNIDTLGVITLIETEETYKNTKFFNSRFDSVLKNHISLLPDRLCIETTDFFTTGSTLY